MICRPRDFPYIPVYPSSRKQWSNDLINFASTITLYTSTSFIEALNLPVSTAQELFESKAWDTWKKNNEAELKIMTATPEGINEVIRAIGVLCKVVARRGF